MQITMPVMTLQNLMEYNDTIFDNIVLPSGADRNLMIASILFNYGEMQVLYQDWSVFRFSTENWFSAHLSQMQHLFNDWESSYNPIYNKDGYYEETRTPNLVHNKDNTQNNYHSNVRRINNTANGTTNTEENPGSVITESGSVTDQYKGFNSSTFNDVTKELPGRVTTASGSNEAKTTNSSTENGTVSDSATISNTGNEVVTETGNETIMRHEYGNIGTITAATLIGGDVKFWESFSFYDLIAKLFAVDNLIMIY